MKQQVFYSYHYFSICFILAKKHKKIKKQKETKHIVALEFVSFIVFCYFCSRNNLFK